MTENLPKTVGFSDELIRRIAMDIGKQVVAHIDHAHPEMFRAVLSTSSARLSIRNATFNAIMAAMAAADEGRSDERIRQHEKHRRTMRRLQKAAGSFTP